MSLDEHQYDEEGYHIEEECEVCIERNHSVSCECRCGECCESMIVEVTMRDAEREPRIRELGEPIYAPIDESTREQIGWLLNGQEGHCVFFDPEKRLCTIHETRPLCCRVFNCDEQRREERGGGRP